MKFTEKELEKLKKEKMEEIDRWLDNEYGVSYTRLEELHDFVIEQDMKHQDEKEELLNRLHKIKEYLKQVDYEQQHGILSSHDLIWTNIERLCDGKELIGGPKE